MFFIIITIIYILPLIYVFFRIKRHFIPKNRITLYTLVFLGLALLYPLTNFFLQDQFSALSSHIIVLGSYSAVFFLYLLTVIVLLDVFLLFNKWLKMVHNPLFKSVRQKTKGLWVVVMFPILVVIGGSIHFSNIQSTHYQIEVPRRSSQLDHLKIAFIADFHLQQRTNINFVERVKEKINTIDPDLMLFGGDILEGDGDEDKLGKFEDLIRQINNRYGSYGVIGNHEVYGGDDTEHFFERAGIELIKDSVVVINNSLNLIGRLDQHIDDRKSPEELLKQGRDSLPVIMLDHRPTKISEVSNTRVDVQLSGHTHNGQLFPFNLITQNIYPLSWGHKKINNSHFFVTSGIRLWGPPVRTTGISEIVVIDVKFR